eukprot:scaffold258565_cov28-Tisochrysis_lutea.AAC.2
MVEAERPATPNYHFCSLCRGSAALFGQGKTQCAATSGKRRFRLNNFPAHLPKCLGQRRRGGWPENFVARVFCARVGWHNAVGGKGILVEEGKELSALTVWPDGEQLVLTSPPARGLDDRERGKRLTRRVE